MPTGAGACLGVQVDLGGEGRRGRVLLSEIERNLPTTIRFDIAYRPSHYTRPSITFLLNYTPLGTWTGVSGTGSCRREEFVVSDTAIIASAA